jgi:hypothetical protein
VSENRTSGQNLGRGPYSGVCRLPGDPAKIGIETGVLSRGGQSGEHSDGDRVLLERDAGGSVDWGRARAAAARQNQCHEQSVQKRSDLSYSSEV